MQYVVLFSSLIAPPEALTPENLKDYFLALVESHSWSMVKINRLGLQFYWRHILKKDWQWVDIVKPPKVKTIPDILTLSEIERLIGATRKLRYRVFLLTTYSMGLRLEESLSLQIGDIDTERKLIHIRRGKGRGVISEKNILSNRNGQVTFRYKKQ